MDQTPQVSESDVSQAAEETQASTRAATPEVKQSRQPRTALTAPAASSRPVRMQYYLVIGLVLLTLVILILLLVMLVSKSRWANSSSPIKPGEFLERQDERIAALDAKIHEQLKRYEQG